MAFQKKSSATSETVLVSAAANFKKSLAELESGIALVKGLDNQVENLQATIASKEDKIAELDVQFSEKKRQAEVDLELSIKQNQQAKVDAILKGQNKVAIDVAELNRVQNAYRALETDFASKLKTETDKGIADVKLTYENKTALAESQFLTKEAQNSAQINQLQTQVSFLNDQVKMWKDALDAERQAGIERAKAGAIQNLNLSGGQGK